MTPAAVTLPSGLITEFPFTLPRGLVDAEGTVHRHGHMRLSTARDEMLAQKDRRIHDYPGYATLVLLSQVITQLGTLSQITPEMLENLFSPDLAYLREAYHRLNQQGHLHIPAQCPHCSQHFDMELASSGEGLATP
ncbi:MAG: phage tail assembly protein [Leptolyngbyaceae bacterium]|nr:phage tail assembly protein [Leptolyngbyaceae bacterium]